MSLSMRIKTFLLKILVQLLKLCYQPFRLLRPRDKLVMITRQTNHPPLDYVLLRDAVLSIDPEHKIVILSKRIGKSYMKKLGYCLHMFRQMYHIATAHVIVTDGYCMALSLLPHRKDQCVVQIWHAINAIKNFGHLAVGKPYGHRPELAEAMHMHSNYDVVTCCSRHTAEVYSKAFGVPTDKIAYLGLPRIDYIQTRREDIIDAMRRKYPQIKDKPCILYAPTFRKGKMIPLELITQAVDLDRYNLVVKLHPIDQAGFQPGLDSRVICDKTFLPYDWMQACDMIITDYSSIAVESTLLEKPLYFFLYDYDDYNSKNGLIMDIFNEPIGRYIAHEPDELREMLSREYDMAAVRAYRDKYVEVAREHCSEKMAAWLLELEKQMISK